MKLLRKINLDDINNKSLIKYISSLLLIILAVSLIGLKIYYSEEDVESVVSTEISKINAIDALNGESIGNYKVEITNYDESSYYIKVNCKTQTVSVYVADENGDYSIPVRTMVCSTGLATPSKGVYEISDKYEWRYLVGGVYGQYSTRITGQILFHSVPYSKMDKSTLEYWEYDKLGTPVSKGCVRLTVEDAKWIYDHCKVGTKVEFCKEDDNRKNVKLPEITKISVYDEELRGWDPTDPDPQNPWREFNNKKGESN